MAIANADGSIILTTKVDDSGLKQSTKNLKSEAAKLAAEYRKAGASKSEAMKKAWQEVNKTRSETEKATKSTQEYGEQAQKSGGTAKSAFSSVGGALKKLAVAALAAFSVQKIVQFSTEASNLATQAEASVQRLIDIYGEASKALGDFIDANAQALGMSKSAAAPYSSVYGNLFSVWADQETNAALTAQYLQMTAVVASKTGRTVGDVQERIRSGLLGNTEAIEDLGIFVNVKTIEMTDAFKRMANGKSWEQLDAYTQQQIRTFAILEQSTNKYGTEVANTSALVKSQFNAAWQDFQATWGQVVNRVLIPILEFLTDILLALNEVAKSLFNISNATISEADAIEGATKNQEKLTEEIKESEKATKKLLAKFDDIEILSADKSDEGTGNILPSVMFPNNSVIQAESIVGSSFVSDLKEIFSEAIKVINELFEPSMNAWADAFEGVKQPLTKASKNIVKTFKNLKKETLDPFAKYITKDFIPKITNSFSKNFAPIVEDVISSASIQLSDDFHWAGEKIGEAVNDVIAPTLEQLESITTDTMDVVGKEWEESGDDIIKGMEETSESTKNLWDDLYDNILLPMWESVSEGFSELWDEHLSGFAENVVNFFRSIGEFLMSLWNDILVPLFTWLIEVLGPSIAQTFSTFTDFTNDFTGLVSDVIGGILLALSGLLDFLTGAFSGNWEKVWSGIKDFFEGIWNAIWGIVKGVINLIIDALNALWSGLYGALAAIINGVGDIISGIGDMVGADWGWEVPSTPPLIPRLAQGVVIPGGKPFLAMLGDQPSGQTNIETPLDTMIQAFNMALDNRTTDTVKEEHWFIDDNEIMTMIYKLAKKGEQAQGEDLIESW